MLLFKINTELFMGTMYIWDLLQNNREKGRTNEDRDKTYNCEGE